MASQPHWIKAIRHAALSDIGLRRANNQDSYAVKIASTARQWLDRGHLFVVADGMGAHVAGEVASSLATETVTQSYLKRLHEPAAQALVHAVYDAHRVIREKSRREDAYRDMGTTCDAFAMTPQGLLVAHVGDSRVYRLRGNVNGSVIEQLTFDHSLVWEVCVATNLPFDQAPSYIPKNQITRSLGPTEKLVVDLEGPFPIAVGDVFLACSDGLSGQVTDREIGELLAVFASGIALNSAQPDVAAETLVNLANLRGGPDNITMVIAQATQSNQATEEVEEELRMPLSYMLTALASLLLGVGTPVGFLMGQPLIGGGLAAAAVAALLYFLISAKKFLFEPSPFQATQQAIPQAMSSRGKGPYTRTTCTPSAGFAAQLARILQELRQATSSQQFVIKSPEADRCERQAHEAVKAENPIEAIRNFCMAINHLMRELKKLNVKKG